MRLKKVIAPSILAFFSLFLVTVPVLAYTYYGVITAVESNGTGYSMIGITLPVSNTALVSGSYITPSGLDTLVTDSGSNPLPHMLVDDRVIFASLISGSNSAVFNYEMGNTPISAFSILTGYDGYITTADDAALEPANNFEIEISGYFDTSSAGKYIVKKDGTLELYTSAESEITGSILSAEAPVFNPSSAKNITYLTTSYANAHNVASGDAVGNGIQVGQQFLASYYNVWRSFIIWDTSSIPDGATITSAVLTLSGIYDTSTSADFDIVVTNGQPTYPRNPIVGSDFDYTKYSGDGGSVNTASITPITLNATGISWINKTGSTKLALRSSGDIASTSPSGLEYISATEATLTLTYDNSVSVTGTGITSGEHTITLIADGTDLKLYDGETEKDSIALSGASALNTANDFIWLDDNSVPYADYIKYTKGGTLLITYQPTAIISGTTLPDVTGTAQNGIFTFGANPAGLAVSIGSLSSSGGGDFTSQPNTNIDPNIVPGQNQDLSSDTRVTSSPFYPFFDAIYVASGNTLGVDLQAMMFATVFAVGFAIMGGVISQGRSFFLVVAGLGVGAGIGYALGFYQDVWILYVIVVLAIAALLLDARKSW
jgi:hypothetical protein